MRAWVAPGDYAAGLDGAKRWLRPMPEYPFPLAMAADALPLSERERKTKTMKTLLIPVPALVLLLGAGLCAVAQSPAPAPGQTRVSMGAGSTIFGNYCENCHGNPKVDSAPSPAVLKQMTPERIYQALTTGDMVNAAKDLSGQDKKDIAEWVSGRRLGATESGDGRTMPNQCAANPPIRDLTSAPAWNGWSDIDNTRFQKKDAAGLTAATVARLQLKWVFALPAAAAVYGQPTIVDGKVFVSSDAGWVYVNHFSTPSVRPSATRPPPAPRNTK